VGVCTYRRSSSSSSSSSSCSCSSCSSNDSGSYGVDVCCRLAIDLAGMDMSWNSSQWVSVHRDVSPTVSENSDDDRLPQLDGLTDNKSTTHCDA